MRPIICGVIRAYQKTVRLALPISCRFHPSCSEYALGAIQKFGIYKGIIKSAGRILRCHPFCPGGYDPPDRTMADQGFSRSGEVPLTNLD